MKRIIIFMAAVLALTVAIPAQAATSTRTTGRICGHLCPQSRLETFGGYRFLGHTSHAHKGDVVRFYFKRAGTSKWHQFGSSNSSSAFKSFSDSRSARVKSDRDWKLWFSPYKPGEWILKAVFERQDGLKRSSVTKHVTVVYSE